MPRKIFKYEITPGIRDVKIHWSRKFLDLQVQGERIVLWAIINDITPGEDVRFGCFGTGWELPRRHPLLVLHQDRPDRRSGVARLRPRRRKFLARRCSMTEASGVKVRLPSRTLLDCHDFDVFGHLSGRLRRVGGQTHVEVVFDDGKNLQAMWVKPRNVHVETVSQPVLHDVLNNFKWGKLLTKYTVND